LGKETVIPAIPWRKSIKKLRRIFNDNPQPSGLIFPALLHNFQLKITGSDLPGDLQSEKKDIGIRSHPPRRASGDALAPGFIPCKRRVPIETACEKETTQQQVLPGVRIEKSIRPEGAFL
jgi:hypothetical protein